MKQIISFQAQESRYGNRDIRPVQNTPSSLPGNIEPQINKNKGKGKKIKTFQPQLGSLCNLFSSYSMSALLWTSGNVQCLQNLLVTLNVFAALPELSWKKSLISKLKHQAKQRPTCELVHWARFVERRGCGNLSNHCVSSLTKTRKNSCDTLPECLLAHCANLGNRKRQIPVTNIFCPSYSSLFPPKPLLPPKYYSYSASSWLWRSLTRAWPGLHKAPQNYLWRSEWSTLF